MPNSAVQFLKGHRHVVNCVIQVGMDGTLATASADHSVKIWSLNDGKCVHTIKAHKNEVLELAAFDAHTILTASADGNASVTRVATGEVVTTLRFLNPLYSCAVFDSSSAVVGDANGDLFMLHWDGHSLKVTKSIEAHDGIVRKIRVRNGLLCTASEDKTTKLWQIATMKLKHTFCGHKNEVLSVALSVDYVVSASSDTTMRVYDARSYKLIRSIETHSKTIWDVTIVEGTNIVISGGDDLIIALHTLPDGVRIAKYDTSMDISCTIDLGSSGRVAVSGCAPCQVKLFDIKELRKSQPNDNTSVVDLCSDDDLDGLFADEQIMTVDSGKTSMRKEQVHRVKPVQVDHVIEPGKGRNSLPEVKQEATKIDTRELTAALHFKALVTKTGCSKKTLGIDEATEALNKVLKTDGLKRGITADEFEEMFIQLSEDIEVSEESWVKVYREVANREKRFESEYVALFDRFIKGRNKTRLLFAIRDLRHGCQDLKERGLLEDVPSLEENETLKLMGTFDKDGDGKLNRDEFVKAALSIIHGIQRDDAQNTNSQAT